MTFNNTFVVSVVILILFIGIVIAFIFTVEYLKNNRFKRRMEEYNVIKKTVAYDKWRHPFERKIYDLENELLDNPRRWEDVNHLLVDAQKYQSNVIDPTINLSCFPFFKNLGVENSPIDKEKVFVLTPFLSNEDATFQAIKFVCAEANLKCVRGDETFRTNEILSHVLSEMVSARIVIANINGRNPNVLYELGICHAIGKRTIIISRNDNDFPFDIAGKNILIYSNLSDLEKKIRHELLKAFASE